MAYMAGIHTTFLFPPAFQQLGIGAQKAEIVYRFQSFLKKVNYAQESTFSAELGDLAVKVSILFGKRAVKLCPYEETVGALSLGFNDRLIEAPQMHFGDNHSVKIWTSKSFQDKEAELSGHIRTCYHEVCGEIEYAEAQKQACNMLAKIAGIFFVAYLFVIGCTKTT